MYYKKIYLPDGTEKLISCEDLEARYDSEGNEISSFYLPRDEGEARYLKKTDAANTYLPRTAGQSKPLTNDLYIDVNGSKNVWFGKNGVVVGRIGVDSDGNMRVCRCASNGDSRGGLISNEGSWTGVFNNGGNIIFRPNGVSSSSGQMYLDTAGQIHGGIKAWTKSASSVSISASANTSMGKITGLSGSGIFAISAYGHIDYNASPYPNNAYINLYKQSGGVIGYYTQYAQRSRAWIHCFDFATNITEVDFKVEPTNACKAWLEMYVWQLS